MLPSEISSASIAAGGAAAAEAAAAAAAAATATVTSAATVATDDPSVWWHTHYDLEQPSTNVQHEHEHHPFVAVASAAESSAQRRAARKPRASELGLVCRACGTTETILWRNKLDADNGPLCNGCGLKLHRKVKAATRSVDDSQLSHLSVHEHSEGNGLATAAGPAQEQPASRKRKRPSASAHTDLGTAHQELPPSLETAPDPRQPTAAESSNTMQTSEAGVATAATIPTVTGIPRRRGPGNMTIPKKVVGGFVCRDCGVTESSLWRYKTHASVGPLCNGCGLKLFRKLNGKEPSASGSGPSTGPGAGGEGAEGEGPVDGGAETAEEPPPKVKGKKRHKVAHLLSGVVVSHNSIDTSGVADAASAVVAANSLIPGQDENAAHQHQQQQPAEHNQFSQDPTQLGPLPPEAAAAAAAAPVPTSDPSPPPSMESHHPHLHPPSGNMSEPNQEVDAQAAQDAVEGFLAAWHQEAARGAVEAVAAAAAAIVAAEGSSSSSPSAAVAGAPSS
ncbi:unnamed protein product [Tilletia controversa]|nr:unnamed protein product [Tilletia controversa]